MENAMARDTAVRRNATAMKTVSAARYALIQMAKAKECAREFHARRRPVQRQIPAEPARTAMKPA